MASVPSELDSFSDFLNGIRQYPVADISPEEAVVHWRALQMSPEELSESVQALREAVEDMKSGDRGVPFDEFVAALRKKHNLAPSA